MTTEGRTEESRSLRTKASILMQLAQVAENLAHTQDQLSALEEQQASLLRSLGAEETVVTVTTAPVGSETVSKPTLPTVSAQRPALRGFTTPTPTGEKAMRTILLEFMAHGRRVSIHEMVSYFQQHSLFSAIPHLNLQTRVSFLLTKMVKAGLVFRVAPGVYRCAGVDKRSLSSNTTNLLTWVRSVGGPVTRTDIVEWLRKNLPEGRTGPSQMATNFCTTLMRRGELRRTERGRYVATQVASA